MGKITEADLVTYNFTIEERNRLKGFLGAIAFWKAKGKDHTISAEDNPTMFIRREDDIPMLKDSTEAEKAYKKDKDIYDRY